MVFAHFSNVVINADIMDWRGIFTRIAMNLPVLAVLVYDIFFTARTDTSVSVYAHTAGAFTGITIGMTLLKNFKPRPCETFFEWLFLSIFVFACLILFILQFFV